MCFWCCKAWRWRTIRFSPTHFKGNGTMTWTVAQGDVITLAYLVMCKTMTIAFEINNTSVGGTPYTQLLMDLPGGVTPKRTMRNQIRIMDAGLVVPGNATVEVNNPQLIFAFNDWTRNFTASTGQTSVNGELTFEFN